jgi:hypothetical protein
VLFIKVVGCNHSTSIKGSFVRIRASVGIVDSNQLKSIYLKAIIKCLNGFKSLDRSSQS